MKLRIRGDSVRLRLSQAEAVQLAETGAVTDSVGFSPSDRLEYGVEACDVSAPAAIFDRAGIRVKLPTDAVRAWLEPEQVTISAEQALGEGGVLSILIEKDFACLTPREGEEDSDAFPNPQAARD